MISILSFTPYSLSISLTRWNHVFFFKTMKNFTPPQKKNVQPLLEAKIFKIIQNFINMDPSSDCCLFACQIWTRCDHWESLKIGSAPLYKSYCRFWDPHGNDVQKLFFFFCFLNISYRMSYSLFQRGCFNILWREAGTNCLLCNIS